MSTMEKVAILARVSTQRQDYERQVVELTREAAGLNEELSNLAEYVSTTVSMSLQLGTWWSQNDFDTCQNIQKLAPPRGRRSA